MIKIPLMDLNRFGKLVNVVYAEFGSKLFSKDKATHQAGRADIVKFLRNNGFGVDDSLSWVIWPTEGDYIMSILRWS